MQFGVRKGGWLAFINPHQSIMKTKEKTLVILPIAITSKFLSNKFA
jgi:hypothetical protein